MKSPNVTRHESRITRVERCKLLGKNKVLWFTGLSGSGKSTLAHALEEALHQQGVATYILDGDNIRHGLNGDLGFSPADREENIRRIAHVAQLFYDAGIMTLVCFISPYKKERELARQLVGEDFVEILVNCSVEECEQRDTKGLYKKARAGEIKEFTGVSAPYEVPENPDLTLNTEEHSVAACVEMLLAYLKGEKAEGAAKL